MNVSVHYQIRGQASNQIAASIEAGIRDGGLPAGEQLPTVRALAARLRVSPTTVASAYHALRVRGLVHGSGRRGTVVNRRPPLLTRAPAGPSGAAAGRGLRDLSVGGPDLAMLPQLKPYLSKLSGDPGRYGDSENRSALIKLAARHFEADSIDADSIAVVSGALDGIERVLQAYLRPGDVVAIEDPSYTGVLDLVAAMGLVAEPVGIDDYGPLVADFGRALKRGAKACIVTPRAQNPTGAAIEPKRGAQLRRVLSSFREVVVIEDDHAGEVAGAPAVTLSTGHPRWATARSVSKSLGPDLRVSVMAGDEQTIARVQGRQSLGPRWVSHMLQDLVVEMWSDPKILAMYRVATETYARRRSSLIASLASHGIQARGRSGLNVWIPVTEEAAIVAALAGRGWVVRAGESYRIRSAPGIRITVADLAPDESRRLAADFAAVAGPRHRPQSA